MAAEPRAPDALTVVRAGMPVVSWTYTAEDWDRHARMHARWLHSMRWRAAAITLAAGTPIALALGILERALVPPLVALAALAVVAASLGGRIRYLVSKGELARLREHPPHAVFTSTGVEFAEHVRLWRTPAGGLTQVLVEQGEPVYLRLEFRGRRRRTRVLRVPVPRAFEGEVEDFARQLASWVPSPHQPERE